MLVLAIDTSHKNGSVCVVRGDASACEMLGMAEVDGGMFSAQLVPVIAKILTQCDITKNDLQGIAAAVGPGSFTGLRIGLAAVKGFAEVWRIPIAGISTLEAVAASAKDAGDTRVLAVLDAGRSEVYVGEYSVELARTAEFLCTREEFVAEINKRREVIVVSPEEFVAEIAKSVGVNCQIVPHPRADAIARLGLKKLLVGAAIGIDELDANYVRRDEGLFSSAK